MKKAVERVRQKLALSSPSLNIPKTMSRRDHRKPFVHWWIGQALVYIAAIGYVLFTGGFSVFGILDVSAACLLGILGGVVNFRALRPYFKEGNFEYGSISARRRVILFLPFLVVALLLIPPNFGMGISFPALRFLAPWLAILFFTFTGYMTVAVVCFERENHQKLYTRSLPGINIEMLIVNTWIYTEILCQIIFGFYWNKG